MKTITVFYIKNINYKRNEVGYGMIEVIGYLSILEEGLLLRRELLCY